MTAGPGTEGKRKCRKCSSCIERSYRVALFPSSSSLPQCIFMKRWKRVQFDLAVFPIMYPPSGGLTAPSTGPVVEMLEWQKYIHLRYHEWTRHSPHT
jgi:hypothetical protein